MVTEFHSMQTSATLVVVANETAAEDDLQSMADYRAEDDEEQDEPLKLEGENSLEEAASADPARMDEDDDEELSDYEYSYEYFYSEDSSDDEEDEECGGYFIEQERLNVAREIQLTNRFAAEALDDGYYENAVLNWKTLLARLTSSVALAPAPLPTNHTSPNNKSQQNQTTAAPASGAAIMGEDYDISETDDSGIRNVYSSLRQARYLGSSSSRRPLEDERDVTDFFGYPFQFVYPRALLRAPKQDKNNSMMMLSSEQYNVAVITSLFNLGLSYHLYWDEHRHQLDALRTALGYYQEAMSLLTQGHITNPRGPLLLVLIAIGVNAIHCHMELSQSQAHVQAWQTVVQDHLLARCSAEERASPEFVILQRLSYQSLLPTSAAAA